MHILLESFLLHKLLHRRKPPSDYALFLSPWVSDNEALETYTFSENENDSHVHWHRQCFMEQERECDTTHAHGGDRNQAAHPVTRQCYYKSHNQKVRTSWVTELVSNHTLSNFFFLSTSTAVHKDTGTGS
jgi:hypothetical protein